MMFSRALCVSIILVGLPGCAAAACPRTVPKVTNSDACKEKCGGNNYEWGFCLNKGSIPACAGATDGQLAAYQCGVCECDALNNGAACLFCTTDDHYVPPPPTTAPTARPPEVLWRVSNADTTTSRSKVKLQAFTDEDCSVAAAITITNCTGSIVGSKCDDARIASGPNTGWQPNINECKAEECWIEFSTIEPVLCVDATDLGKNAEGDWEGGLAVQRNGKALLLRQQGDRNQWTMPETNEPTPAPAPTEDGDSSGSSANAMISLAGPVASIAIAMLLS